MTTKDFYAIAYAEDRGANSDFCRGYISAMYFTDSGEDGDPIPCGALLSDDALESTINDCRQFCETMQEDLARAEERGYTMERAGADFWFTRNGHGVGFWDRDELESGGIGERLTAEAQRFGEVWPCVDDNGFIYI